MFPQESVPSSFARQLCTVYSDHELQGLLTFSYKPHIRFPSLRSLHIIRSFGSICRCCNTLILCWFLWGFLSPRPIPKLDDHSLSAIRNCLFSIFANTLHIWRPFPPYGNYVFKAVSFLQAFSSKYTYNSFISLLCYMSFSSYPLVYNRDNIYCKSL
jgi:hypothetical protein